MCKKLYVLFLGLFLSSTALGDTLFITAKKFGQNQEMKMTYVHVAICGYDLAGSFIIRFQDGHQVSLGKRSAWERFEYTLADDNDVLLP